ILRPSCSGRSWARRTASRARHRTGRLNPVISRAKASPASIKSPSTMWLTRPMRSGSAASGGRPGRVSSVARGSPARRGRRWGPAVAGYQAELDLGKAELGRGRGQAKGAGERQFEPAAKGIAVDQGDRRHRQLVELGQDRLAERGAGALLDQGAAHQLLDV